MIGCCTLVDALEREGWRNFAGVPCSTFDGPLRHLTENGRYFAAANEGLAWSYATGAGLGGRPTALLVQNSGFGNLLNPLTSLAVPYGLPLLVLMSLRGWPDANGDEPQHRVMGSAGRQMLDAVGGWSRLLPDQDEDLPAVVAEAREAVRGGSSAFLLVPRQAIGPHDGTTAAAAPSTGLALTTAAVARLVVECSLPDDVVVSTTGYCSRELYAAGDRPGHFYMQGSMGHASSLALGLADAAPARRVLVLDGDGAALMHMGALAQIGSQAPANLIHVVLDNGTYQSTGGQPTIGKSVRFSRVADACGYRRTDEVDTLDGLRNVLGAVRDGSGPVLVVASGAPDAGPAPSRASAALALPDVATRVAEVVRG